jgi:hypothetical protein
MVLHISSAKCPMLMFDDRPPQPQTDLKEDAICPPALKQGMATTETMALIPLTG